MKIRQKKNFVVITMIGVIIAIFALTLNFALCLNCNKTQYSNAVSGIFILSYNNMNSENFIFDLVEAYNNKYNFYIEDAYGLNYFLALTQKNHFPDIYVCLTNDIDDSSHVVKKAGYTFGGTFDGDGHTISNLSIEVDSYYDGLERSGAGLFQVLGGTVKNLQLKDITIIDKKIGTWFCGIGPIAGLIENNSKYGALIENCHIDNFTYINTDDYVITSVIIGGLAGTQTYMEYSNSKPAKSYFKNCLTTGNFKINFPNVKESNFIWSNGVVGERCGTLPGYEESEAIANYEINNCLIAHEFSYDNYNKLKKEYDLTNMEKDECSLLNSYRNYTWYNVNSSSIDSNFSHLDDDLPVNAPGMYYDDVSEEGLQCDNPWYYNEFFAQYLGEFPKLRIFEEWEVYKFETCATNNPNYYHYDVHAMFCVSERDYSIKYVYWTISEFNDKTDLTEYLGVEVIAKVEEGYEFTGWELWEERGIIYATVQEITWNFTFNNLIANGLNISPSIESVKCKSGDIIKIFEDMDNNIFGYIIKRNNNEIAKITYDLSAYKKYIIDDFGLDEEEVNVENYNDYNQTITPVAILKKYCIELK